MHGVFREHQQSGRGSFLLEHLSRVDRVADTRNKSWIAFHIILATNSDVDFKAVAATAGLHRYMACQSFCNLWVFAHYNQTAGQKAITMPAGLEATDIVTYTFARQSPALNKLTETVAAAAAAASRVGGTLSIEEGVEDIWDWERLLDAVAGWSSTMFTANAANAELAQKRRSANPFQEALLVVQSKLHTFVENNVIAKGTIRKSADVEMSYPENYPDSVQQLELRGLNDATMQFEHKLMHKDYATGAMSMKKLLIIVGKAGTGQTTFANSLGQWFCDGLDAPTFVCTPSFDALGLLTRSGKTMEQGAIIMDDAPFVSQADVPLKELDLISFCNVQHACSFPARYHVGQCPAQVARIYTINAKFVNGKWDFGYHLQSFPGLAALARGDLSYFQNTPDDQQVALARRCLVLCVDSHSTFNIPVAELEANLDEQAISRAARAVANRPVSTPVKVFTEQRQAEQGFSEVVK